MVLGVVTPLDGSSASEEVDVPLSDPKWAGQNASDYLPAVAVVVKLTSHFRGRSKRGRVFMPMTAEGVVSNGVVASGPRDTADAAWAAFVASLTTQPDPVELVIASYKLSSAVSVSGVHVEDIAATQRRRQSRLR
jgi:hypothetical protein